MALPIFKQEGLADRPHISFSEAYSYYKCAYKHWLVYREKLPSEDTIHTIFGKAVGSALERHKKNNVQNSWIGIGRDIFRFALTGGLEQKDKFLITEKNPEGFALSDPLDRDWRVWVKAGLRIFKDTLEYLDTTYPGWKLIDFEYPLNEPISKDTTKKFKGFVDIIFEHDGIIYIFDFKTTKLGWFAEQRQDTHKLYQVALYKHFYCIKTGTDPNKVKTGYLLLKRRTSKKAETCVEFFEQTSGAVKLKNAVEWLSEQAKGIEKGVRVKNTSTCSFCICGAKNVGRKK